MVKKAQNNIILTFLLAAALVFQYPLQVQARIEVGSVEASAYPDAKQELLNKLSYEDLVLLSGTEHPARELQNRLNYVLYNPIVDNSFTENNKEEPFNKDFIRLASWNINRGLNLGKIIEIFSSPDEFLESVENRKDFSEIKEQIDILRNSDIIILNEADIGMPRTGYRNVPEELAKTLGFNYAYGVEFVEVDPSHLGLEDNKWSEERILFPDKEYKVDKDLYKGLHGNAVLSRFPIKSAKIIRLPLYYDWFEDERERTSGLEYLRRKSSKVVFSENIIREIRQGSRIAIVLEIEVPGIDKPLTVVATHFENRVLPDKRYEQLKVVLNAIKNIRTSLVLAGDFNTTSADGRPTSVRRELSKKLKDPEFYIRQAIYYSIPYAYAFSSLNVVANAVRINKDPTAKNIPVISPNKERKFFLALKKFEFNDGGKFDFDGDRNDTSNGRRGLLANSNQRDLKGFTPTFIFERPLFVGKFKLDWFFVKPVFTDDDLVVFEPFNGRTLLQLNYSFERPIADHSPITVDLSLKQEFKKQQDKEKDQELEKEIKEEFEE